MRRTLAKTLGAIDKAGLVDTCKHMYNDSREEPVMQRTVLVLTAKDLVARLP